jgi:hypothetical protein
VLGDKQIWWQVRNAVHTGIALAVLWCFRLRGVYTEIKNAPRRSPKVRRIEIIVATGLWTFILLAVIVFLFATGFRG